MSLVKTTICKVFFAAALLLAFVAPARAQSCSGDYLVQQSFPLGATAQTSWWICWRADRRNGLEIHRAFFRPKPSSPWIQVLGPSQVSEIFVPYHSGDPGYRFYDISIVSAGAIKLTEKDCPSLLGKLIGEKSETCLMIRDQGIAWKYDQEVKRGQEVLLWGTIASGNYYYVIEWTFRDDGTILGRVGATGQNNPGHAKIAHMHTITWRLDVDLNGPELDTAYLARHVESGLKGTDFLTPIPKAGGLAWNALELSGLHIHDRNLKNARGNPAAYHLKPQRYGNARHQEPFTHQDFWITLNKPNQELAKLLPTYVAAQDPVVEKDIVVWYTSGLHHLVRDEDGYYEGNLWKGRTHAMWAGFMMMPHNLFDRTPFFP